MAEMSAQEGMSAQDLEEMVASERPGYDVISVDKSDEVAEPDATEEAIDRTPDLDELRREFLGDSAEEFDTEGAMAEADTAASPQLSTHDDESVRVLRLHPKSRERDALEHGPGAKTIVVSNKDGIVLAEQG